jgi:hypothetical protein
MTPTVYWYIAIPLMLFFILSALYYWKRGNITRIPEGHAGWNGEEALEGPAEWKTHSHVQLIDLSPQVSSFTIVPADAGKPKFNRILITWKPDIENLATFVRQKDIEAELKKRYATLPDLDFDHHAKLLGIEILKIEKNEERKSRPGVSLGEGVSIPD